MVFRKINEADHKSVMDYLKKEKDFNLFIIGDIENFGYNSDFQTLWGVFANNKLQGVLLRFHESYIPYTYDEEIMKKFAPLISLGAKTVSGKKEIIDLLRDHLKSDIVKVKQEYFAKVKELNRDIKLNKGLEIKKATVEDIPRLKELRDQIEEFQDVPFNREMIERKINTKSGRIYYIENEQGKIISKAATSAENSYSAMVVGVATAPDYRQQGLATYLVYRLAKDLIKEEKTPCLFYDNPAAGKIYRRIGFEEMGQWTILRL